MSLQETYFEALRTGDFKTWCSFATIKDGKDQSAMLFSSDKWSEEQVSFYRDSRGSRFADGKPRYDVVVKSRRIGMTTFGCLQDYFFAISNPGRDVMFVAQDEATRVEGLEIIRNCHDQLAEWGKALGIELVPEYAQDNVRTIKFSNGSRILSEVSKANKVAAKKAGRGKTISRLHCTEVSFWTYPEETMLSLLEASSNAKEVLVESTPNGSTGWFYDLVQRSERYKPHLRKDKRLETKWRLHFFPWFEHSDYALDELPYNFDPTPQNKWEADLLQKEGITDAQLAWWRAKAEDHGIAAVLQEYPNDLVSCFRASASTFLREDDLAWLAQNHFPPIETRDCYGVPVSIWHKPHGSTRYIIGVDMGYGRGADFSAFYVLSAASGEIVASGASNDVDTATFARMLAQIGREYNDALIAVEHQAAGHACINDLQNKERYSNLFKHKDKDYYGWNTSNTSRTQMFYNIQSVVSEREILIPDATLINEFKNIVISSYTQQGKSYKKPEAMKGANDDRTMAWGIALSVWLDVPRMESIGYISVKKRDIAVTTAIGAKSLGRRGKGYL